MKGTVTTYIPGELESLASDGVVASSEAIFDYNQEKSQEQFNSDIIDTLENVQSTIDVLSTAYFKPQNGIPRTDMTNDVQISLNKADTAYQKPENGILKSDLSQPVQTSLNKADSAYQKPQGGIPKNAMTNDVQMSLDKADSALQNHQDLSFITEIIPSQASSSNQLADKNFVNTQLNGKQNTISDLETIRNKATTAYQKPLSGIPKTDLENEVRISLNKADTALQSETDPTIPSWAKQQNKPTYTAQEVGALPSNTFIPSTLSDLTEDDSHQTVTAQQKAKLDALYTKAELDEIIEENELVTSAALNSLMTEIPTNSDKALWNSAVQNASAYTYAELAQLKSNSELISGQYYRLTDYEFTTIDPESMSAGHQFDLILLAIDVNLFANKCFAVKHTGDIYFNNVKFNEWQVWYQFDNDNTLYSWTDPVNGKGVITRLVDEWMNDIQYDFKNAMFKRYKVTAQTNYAGILDDLNGLYIGAKGGGDVWNGVMKPYVNITTGFDIDENDYKWFYTLTVTGSTLDTITDGSIGDNNISEIELGIGQYQSSLDGCRTLNNTVFINGEYVRNTLNQLLEDKDQNFYDYVVESNTLNYSRAEQYALQNIHLKTCCKSNTFFGDIFQIYTASQFRNNLIVGNFRHTNCIGSGVQNNTIVSRYDSSFNIFTGKFANNIVSTTQSFSVNQFGPGDVQSTVFSAFYFGGNRFTHASNNTIKAFNIQRIYINYISDTFIDRNLVSYSTTRTGNEFISNSISDVTANFIRNCSIQSGLKDVTIERIGYVGINVSNSYMLGASIIGKIEGTSSSFVQIDYSELFENTSVSTNLTKSVSVYSDKSGGLYAVYFENGQQKIAYKAPGTSTWTLS